MLKIIGLVVILLVIAASIFFLSQKQSINFNPNKLLPSSNKAVDVGRSLSNNACNGEGVPYKLSQLPMKLSDFSHIEPYGHMIGDHLTPIDHQYFSPTIFHSPIDTYDVYAMADAKLVSIEDHPTRKRLVFSVTCTFFYYYDLLTSLEPGIKQKSLPIEVKAGQLIGRIGGQTLDFAVWDTTKPLPGFIVPEHYQEEPWKIYTADPLDYYTDEIKKQILSKYVRTAEPKSGKIDYDIDGKLIGNWFLEGSKGYAGEYTDPTKEYWKDELSFSPYARDPTAYIISVDFLASNDGSRVKQFSVPRSAPGPETIGVDSGLVKYELKAWEDLRPDGKRSDNMDFMKGPKLNNENTQSLGCALFEMLEVRKLKFEVFLRQSCENVSNFSSNAKTYER